MLNWKYIVLACIGSIIVLTGCGHSSIPESSLHEKEDADKRTSFGNNYIENDDIVVYLKPNKDLYIYHHKNREEFLVAKNVDKFDVFNEYVVYITDDGFTSELDIPLQSIYKANIQSGKSKQIITPTEENDSYTTPRDFHVNKDGYIAVETEVGFFHSNYWSMYTITDISVSFEKPMLTLEDEYDYVPNEIQWQDDKMFFLIEKVGEPKDDGLHTELRSYSINDGEQLIQEQSLPLSSEEYEDLFNHTVYIGVEDSILYMSGVDDEQVEQIAYEIDLDTHEIIHKTPNN